MKKRKTRTVFFVPPSKSQLDTIEASYSIFAQRPKPMPALGITVHIIFPVFNLRRLEPRRC